MGGESSSSAARAARSTWSWSTCADSPSRGHWLGVELSARATGGSRTCPRDSRRATRRSRTTPRSIRSMSHHYVPEAARGVRWDDPALGHRLAPGGAADDLGPRPGVARADGAVTGARSGGALGVGRLRLQRPGGPTGLPGPLARGSSARGGGRVPADRQHRRLVRDGGSGAQPRCVPSEPRLRRLRPPGRLSALTLGAPAGRRRARARRANRRPRGPRRPRGRPARRPHPRPRDSPRRAREASDRR